MVENQEYQNTKPYAGLGDYEISFDFSETSDVVVVWVSDAGIESDAKVEGVDYSIVTVGAYAYVRVLIDYGEDGLLVYYRDMPLTQNFRGVDGTDPPPSSIMIALDRIVYMVQQLYRGILGALTVPASESSDMTIPRAEARRGGFLAFDDTAEALPIVADGVTDTPVSTFMADPLLAADGDEFCEDVGAATEDELDTAITGVESSMDEMLDIIAKQADDFTWSKYGDTEDLGMVNAAHGVALSSSLIAVLTETSGTLSAYAIDASGGWSIVGSPLSITDSTLTYITMVRLSATRVAITYGSPTTVYLAAYDFSGTAWSLVGSALSLGMIGHHAMGEMTSSVVAIYFSGNLRAYSFSGSAWSATGNILAISSLVHPAMCKMSNSRIALTDDSTALLRAYDFDGTDFTLFGNTYNLGSLSYPDIAGVSSNRISFVEYSSNEIRTLHLIGEDWVEIGDGRDLTATGASRTISMMSPRRALYIYGYSVSGIYFEAYDMDMETDPPSLT